MMLRDDEQLQSRVLALEKQLLQLRSEFTVPVEPLPAEPFTILEVRVGASWYGLATSAIREVVPLAWCQPVPDSPGWVLGTLRYRGETILVCDLRMRLEDTPLELHPSMVIVVVHEPKLMGFAATGIGDLDRIEPAQVAPPTPGISQATFLRGSIPGRAGSVLHLLSVERLSREYVLVDPLASEDPLALEDHEESQDVAGATDGR